MEDAESVKKALDHCVMVGTDGCINCPYLQNMCCVNALCADASDMIASLEERIKTLEKRNEPMMVNLESDGVIKYAECPVCGETLQKIWNQKYCGACGQAVKWE